MNRSFYWFSRDPVVTPAPNTFGQNLRAWFSADYISGVDNDAIGTWVDRSGYGNNLTQATGAAQPILKLNIVNTQPVLRFDAARFMSFAVALPLPIHMFAVVRPLDLLANYTIIGGPANGLLWRIQTGGKQELYKTGAVTIGTSGTVLSTTLFSYITVYLTVAGLYLFRLNGVADGTATNNKAPVASDRMGETNGIDRFKGDIAELLLYSGVQTSDDVTLAESYLKTKYGL